MLGGAVITTTRSQWFDRSSVPSRGLYNSDRLADARSVQIEIYRKIAVKQIRLDHGLEGH